MSFQEDFTPFFQTVDWADAIIYTPAGGDPVTINAIFDHAYVEVLGVEAERPVIHFKIADIPDIAHSDAITIGSVNYLIVEVQPDGTGVSVAVLEAQ